MKEGWYMNKGDGGSAGIEGRGGTIPFKIEGMG